MIHIEPMKEADLDGLAQLYLEAYAVSGWPVSAARSYLQKFLRFEPERCLVAKDAERVVGGILGYSYDKPPGPVLYVQELFVDPKSRNHGVGKQLISALRESLSKATVHVKPLVKADTTVINFYNSLGFERAGAISFSLDE